jgi:UDP-N-acetyl-D-glucosamine dehydrogenase
VEGAGVWQHARFIELAGKINTAMPEHVVHRVADALNTRNKAVKGSRVLFLGLAYKLNVDDDRESTSYVLMYHLSDLGAELEYYDPYLPVIKPTRQHPHRAGKKSVEWDRPTIESFDLVLIATNHSCVNYQDLLVGPIASWTRETRWRLSRALLRPTETVLRQLVTRRIRTS